MNRPILAILCIVVAAVIAGAKPTVKPEEAGLKLLGYQRYIVLSPLVPENGPVPAEPHYRRQTFAVLENCGDKPITIPTFPTKGHAGQITGGEDRIKSFDFAVSTFKGRKIVESPSAYQPVTLAPSESTLLPVQSDTVYSMEFERTITEDFVSYQVSEELAKRHGWWSGTLLARIPREAGQQAIQGTPAAAPPSNPGEVSAVPHP